MPSGAKPDVTEDETSLYPKKDYERIATAIDFLRRHRFRQPDLEELSVALGLSEFHLQRLFTRWAGISPKRFLQLLTLEEARAQLRGAGDLLGTALDAGLSGPGRLHDLFVTLEAMTPGEFKQQGRGLVIHYGVHDTPFGPALLGETERGICALEFGETKPEAPLPDRLRAAWPQALWCLDHERTAATISRLFARPPTPGTSLSLWVKGTNFQTQVWRALLRIPAGTVVSYADIAREVGRPRATRAVGSAIGANPIAWLIPCHRVLRSDGQLGGYAWGETRKQALLAWEQSGFEAREGPDILR